MARNVGLLLAFKLIADMFPSLAVLDYASLGFALLLFVLYFGEFSKVRLGWVDCVALLLLVLIAFNVLLDMAGVVIAVKMSSAFLLYFLGRAAWRDAEELLRYLWAACLIVLAVNLATAVVGAGFQTWGRANTFSGMYYFKTDLANAMTFIVSLALFFSVPSRRLRFIVVMVASILVLLSNARVYLFVLPCIYLLCWMMHKGKAMKLRHIVVIVAVMTAMLFVLRFLGTTAFFRQMGFISLQFDSFSDLLNGSNTQGRNYLFAEQMARVWSSGLVNQLFGNGFTGDIVLMDGHEYSAHSLYVGTVFNLGYVGVALLVALLIIWFCYAKGLGVNEMGFLLIALGVTFAVSGLSFDVLQYTANSWYLFFFAGCVVSMRRDREHT